MLYHKNFKSLVIWWNNTFPADKWWREKHNIAFNSPQHRGTSQIDVYFEYIEFITFEKYYEDQKVKKIEEEEFKKGNIMKEQIVDDSNIEELFKKADFSFVNSGINIE